MGSFKGHVLPGTLFLAVGAWHVWAAVARFAMDPAGFRLRVWNPVGAGGGALRHLELYVIAGGAFLDMCVEVLYSTHLHIFAPGGGVNPAHLNDLEHGGMLLMFFLVGALALLSENTRARRYLPLTEGALCLLAATAYTAELLLFYFHSTTHQGLEGYYHYLLVVLVGLCVASAVLGALLPASFPADLASGLLITLQGLWFYQTAFTLYGPMLPEGCHRDAGGDIDCHGHAAGERAEQLADFQLFAYVFLVFAYALGCYAVAAARYGHPDLRAVEMEEHRENGGFVGSSALSTRDR
uniref:Transmembrane protein 45B n=1 Tax=Aegilops tauschii subsp. strangulata TaxID=200361 RepID=A0A453GIF0_AEGTS